jgi:hypothetical protein
MLVIVELFRGGKRKAVAVRWSIKARLTRRDRRKGREEKAERRTTMKIFLAGATGAIGKRLLPQLVRRGHMVTATTRTPDKVDSIRRVGAAARSPERPRRNGSARNSSTGSAGCHHPRAHIYSAEPRSEALRPGVRIHQHASSGRDGLPAGCSAVDRMPTVHRPKLRRLALPTHRDLDQR